MINLNIRLTFIVCTYNGSKRLPETLSALIAASQKTSGCEILVIDNASTDNTQIVAEEQLKDSGIPYTILLESKPGKANALKLAFSQARGVFFSVVDDDNLVSPDWCDIAINYLDTRANVGLIGPKIIGMFPEGEPPQEYYDEPVWQGMLGINDLGDQVIEGKYPFGAGMTGRTHVMNYLYEYVGTYLADRVGDKLTSGEDHEKALMFKALGWQGVYCPSLQLQHVIPKSRLNKMYIDRVILSAMRSVDWLEILGKLHLSRITILRNIAVDFLFLLRFSIKSIVVTKGGDIKRDPRFWRSFYWSRFLGSIQLLTRYSEGKQILEKLAKAPNSVRSAQ